MGDILKTLGVIITIIAAAFAFHFYQDKTYAKEKPTCEKIETVYAFARTTAKQLNVKIESDVLNNKQQRYFMFEDRYGPNGEKAPDPVIKEEMKQMRQDIKNQENKVRSLEQESPVK